MDMNDPGKRLFLVLLVLCLVFLLSGCRTRVTGTVPEASLSEGDSFPGVDHPGSVPDNAAEPDPSRETNESGSRTRENPDSDRREYDESAPVEIVPGTERSLHTEGEGAGAPLSGGKSSERVSRLNDRAEQPASQTVPADSAEKQGVSEDADAAESAMTYFTVLLEDRTGSLFECQRLNVYWETPVDHLTIHKSSPEHRLILQAGAYDVSARLLPENLTIDGGWVVRKNPGVIVKVVDSGILGSGVSDTAAAEAVYRRILAREGWSAVEAVRENRVVLLSRELLEAPYLQTAAALILAKAANASLFADVRPDEALRMLAEEATGTFPSGIFYYSPGEDGL